jgi:hypothetical protein
MAPGTYTVTMSNGAIQIIIVTTTLPVIVTTTVTTTTLTDQVTLTNQAVAAVAPPAYEVGWGSGDAGTLTVTAASAEGTCPPACDCSWVRKRKADE